MFSEEEQFQYNMLQSELKHAVTAGFIPPSIKLDFKCKHPMLVDGHCHWCNEVGEPSMVPSESDLLHHAMLKSRTAGRILAWLYGLK